MKVISTVTMNSSGRRSMRSRWVATLPSLALTVAFTLATAPSRADDTEVFFDAANSSN